MEKECFGTMYPNLLSFRFEEENRGKVFTARIKTKGGVARDRDLSVDRTAWDACRGCELYSSCYDLSTASYIAAMGLRSY